MPPPPPSRPPPVSVIFILLSLLAPSLSLRPNVLVITDADLDHSADDKLSPSSADWDDFANPNADHELGSWRQIFERHGDQTLDLDRRHSLYSSAVRSLISASSSGDSSAMDSAVSDMESAASAGDPHAQSALGFLYGVGITRPKSRPKSFLYHQFAAEGDNVESKMVIAYYYYRHRNLEKAAELYAELAEAALASFLISKDPPVIEPVRIHFGSEENKEALKKSRGEDNEDFHMAEYMALKGSALHMFDMGIMYYYGLRGLRRDYGKALSWFSKSAEKWEPKAMEFLGEMYARGAGVERDYGKAMQWLMLAAEQKQFSAYNGLGYLYVKGYGVEKNVTKMQVIYQRKGKTALYVSKDLPEEWLVQL